MTREEYNKKVQVLQKQLKEFTEEYVDSNKIYNVGDNLHVSFRVPYRNNKLVEGYVRIMNIYPLSNTRGFGNLPCPTGGLVYFARYLYRQDRELHIGDHCPLGMLSQSNNTCGYKDIDWDTVSIKVVSDSEVK